MRDENCFNLGISNGFSGFGQRNCDGKSSELRSYFDQGCLIEKAHENKFDQQYKSQEYDLSSTGCVHSNSEYQNSTKSIHCFSKGNMLLSFEFYNAEKRKIFMVLNAKF